MKIIKIFKNPKKYIKKRVFVWVRNTFHIVLLIAWLLAGYPKIPFTNFPLPKEKVFAALPSYVSSGGVSCAGTAAAITPTMPGSLTTNDILLFFIETGDQAVTIADSGSGTWTETPDSPQSQSGSPGTRLTAFWSRYNGSQTAPTTSAPANHVCGVIIAITGVTTSGSTPFDVTSGGVDGTGPTTLSITGDTTSGADRFIVAAVADDWDNASATRYTNWTNTDLANINERVDGGGTNGNGGGLGVMTGEKASAGTYGTTTVDQNASILLNGFMTLALKPTATTDQSGFRWRTDDGSETTATWKDDENDAITNFDRTSTVRLRVEAESASSFTLNARLEFSSNATNCTDGSWTQLNTSSTIWQVVASSNITNGDSTTDQLTSSAKSFTAGRIFDTQNEDTTGVALNNTHSEWEWSIKGVLAGDNQAYRFRVTDAGTALAEYSQCATLTTATATGYHQPHYRIRAGDAAGLNADSDWAAALDTYANMDAGKRFRIRFEVAESSSSATSKTWLLQYRYRTSTGAWDAAWANAPNRAEAAYEGPIHVLDSDQYVTDAAASTNLLAGSALTFDTGGTGQEDRTTGALTISNEHAEYEFTIMIRGTFGPRGVGTTPKRVKDNDQLEFRMIESPSTAFTGVYNNPRVTVNMPDGYIGSATIESPNHIGPFKDTNGNLYFLIEPTYISGAGNFEPQMIKSTDAGVTWDYADTAGHPTNSDDVETADVYQSGDTLHICIQKGVDSSNVKYNTFRMSDHASPDTWGTIDDSVTSFVSSPGNQACGIVRRADGTVVVAYRYTDGTNQRVGYNIRSSGGSWGGQQNLDTTASTNFTFTGIVLGESDLTHIFYRDDTNNVIYTKSLTSGDTLNSRQTVESDAQAGSDDWGTTPAVYWDNGGTEEIMIGVLRASDSKLYSINMSDDGAPEARKSISTSAVNEAPGATGSDQPVADLVIDSATDTTYSLFSYSTDFDLYKDSAVNDGGWGTDTSVLTATRMDYVRGNVYTHSAGNGGAKVYGYVYEDNGNGDNGFSWYDEINLNTAPSAPTTLYVNEGDNTAQSGVANPVAVGDGTPNFSAIYNDSDSGDIANKYEVIVYSESSCTTQVWDSGSSGTSMTNCTQGNRCADITFAGTALPYNGITYYWKIKYWDDDGSAGSFSACTENFTILGPADVMRHGNYFFNRTTERIFTW